MNLFARVAQSSFLALPINVLIVREFNLHKFCAESAPNLDKCPPFLRTVKPDQHDFRRTHKCGNCEEFLDDCCDCLLQTHLNHGFLPTILHPKQHPHFLNFIIMPFKYNYQYKCCICDKLGSSVSYKCYDCFYDVHVNCVLPDLIIKTKNSGHRFFLIFNSSSDDKPGSKHQCDICNKEIDLGQPFYRCSMLDLQFHLRCMADERQVDVLISNKKLTRVYEDFEPTSDWLERSEDYSLVVDFDDFEFKEEEIYWFVDPSNSMIVVMGERPIPNNKWLRFNKKFHIPKNSDVAKIHMDPRFLPDALVIIIQKIPKL
ncbi:hypothetical protein GH714_011733 [Hevea brasiliensis]|uniref:DC1 domain-containing protein n=1 Tax=Hevea brasiliensis TaxID=3981 RepID=A0A6A6LIF4_HEVBR|nr:hypothetical protein GH714_011733 [Hevea brasiliensis]